MEKLKNYILDSIDEIRNKVSWPKFSELQSSAILVLVASFIFAVVIGLIDFCFRGGVSWYYTLNNQVKAAMGELKWYVLRVISGQEKKVKSYLETDIERSKLQESIPQVLIPSEKVYEMRNGKKRVRERNFFPGYVIISADLSNGEAYHTVNNIPGVIGFLGNNGTGSTKDPVALRQSEVNRILGKVDEIDQQDEKLEKPFIRGESVKVMDGPFSGFTGSVEEIFEDKKKLNVTVKIFGRNTPVELSYMQVEKLE